MALEIERKFLVKNDDWKRFVISKAHLRDGLVERSGRAKVRVRIADGNATVALKSHRTNGVRSEYEYEIPVEDGEKMLAELCDHTLEKTRHCVEHASRQWVVDVYEGLLDGIIIAEIELSAPDEIFSMPDWLGDEVTTDPRYQKINMVLERKSRRKLSFENQGELSESMVPSIGD